MKVLLNLHFYHFRYFYVRLMHFVTFQAIFNKKIIFNYEYLKIAAFVTDTSFYISKFANFS